MFRLVLILLILLGISPVMADTVVVKREKRNTESILPPVIKVPEQKIKAEPTKQEIAQQVRSIKQEIIKYAKKQMTLSDKNFEEMSDICDLKSRLQNMGAEGISGEIIGDQFDTYVIDGKTYKKPYRCVKISFEYLGKPYEAGACRFVPHTSNGIIMPK